jgi:predicted PolB exonuclease-like 3'-5' exonuclease
MSVQNTERQYRELKNLLFIDIETATSEASAGALSEPMQELWIRRAQHLAPELSADDAYRTHGALQAEFGKVICIGVGYFHTNDRQELSLRTKTFAGHNEKLLLTEFYQLLETRFNRKTRLVAHNGKEFDYPYLCKRMLLNRLPLPSILDIAEMKPWEVRHLDTMELWRFGDRRSFTSLKLLATIFGIPHHKNALDGSKIHALYHEQPDNAQAFGQIAAYCRQDVIVTAQVYLSLKNMPILEASQIVEIG